MNSFVVFGYLATFACGWLNVEIILKYAPFSATHITGSLTRIPVNMLEGNWGMFFSLIGIVSAFIVGVAVSSFINPRGDGNFTRNFGIGYIIGASLLFIFTIVFGGSYMFVIFCSLFAGFQNGFLSQFKLRVSHMSGVATDVGVELGRICKESLKKKHPNKHSILKSYGASIGMRILFIVVFVTGAFVGAVLTMNMHQIPVMLMLTLFDVIIAIYYLRICPRLRRGDEYEGV